MTSRYNRFNRIIVFLFVVFILPTVSGFGQDNTETWQQIQSRFAHELTGMNLFAQKPAKPFSGRLTGAFYYKNNGRQLSITLPVWKHAKDQPPRRKHTRVVSAGSKAFNYNATYISFSSTNWSGSSMTLDSWIRDTENSYRKEYEQREVKSAYSTIQDQYITQFSVTPTYQVSVINKNYSGLTGKMMVLSANGQVKTVGMIPPLWGSNFRPVFERITVQQPIRFVAGFEFQSDSQKRILVTVSVSENTRYRSDIPFPSEAEIDRMLERAASIILETFGGAEPPSPIEVFPTQGDLAGSPLEDGDILMHIMDLDNPESLTLNITGLPSGGAARDMFIDVQNRHRPLFHLSGPEVQPTDNGYTIKHSDATLSLNLNFKADALHIYRTSFPDGPMMVIPLILHSDQFKKHIFVQLSEWELIVSRFEIRQRGSESSREFRARETVQTVGDYRFNEYIELRGKLWDTWNEGLYRLVRSGRTFGPDDPVIMGWAKNWKTGHTFFSAEDNPSDPGSPVPAYNAEAELVAEFDLEILLDPKAQTRQRAADSEYDVDVDQEVNTVDEQRRIWRDFQVEEFKITVHEVNGTDMRRPASQEMALRGPVATKRRGYSKVRDYSNLIDIDNFTKELRHEFTVSDVYSFGPMRKSGIYEVRLYIKIQRGSDMEDYREADVSVRIKVVRSGFNAQVIQWTTERGR